AGTPLGKQARIWLRENGARPEQAAEVIERAQRHQGASSGDRVDAGASVRLEVIDSARHQVWQGSDGEGREREERDNAERGTARSGQRQRRQAWARRRLASDSPAAATIAAQQAALDGAASRSSSGRSPPRSAR